MKRLKFIIIPLVTAMLCTGCGVRLEGSTWRLTAANIYELPLGDDLLEDRFKGLHYIFENSGVVRVIQTDTEIYGKYTVFGDTVTIKTAQVTFKGQIEGNTMTVEIENGTMEFKKDQPLLMSK